MQYEEQKVRLNKFLANSGFGSRRGVEQAVLDGHVSINGKVVKELATFINPSKDKVQFKNKLALKQKPRIFLFHKPVKVVTTLSDPQSRVCLSEYLKNMPVKVFPVGRLDYDVCGLLILTNDGDYAHKLLHPSFEVTRTYIAEVRGEVQLEKFTDGIKLDDGFGKASSASFLSHEEKSYLKHFTKTKSSGTSFVKLEVKEGRKHFVKKLCKALDNPIAQLLRVGFGEYSLGKIPSGKIKEVTFRFLPSK